MSWLVAVCLLCMAAAALGLMLLAISGWDRDDRRR